MFIMQLVLSAKLTHVTHLLSNAQLRGKLRLFEMGNATEEKWELRNVVSSK